MTYCNDSNNLHLRADYMPTEVSLQELERAYINVHYFAERYNDFYSGLVEVLTLSKGIYRFLVVCKMLLDVFVAFLNRCRWTGDKGDSIDLQGSDTFSGTSRIKFVYTSGHIKGDTKIGDISIENDNMMFAAVFGFISPSFKKTNS